MSHIHRPLLSNFHTHFVALFISHSLAFCSSPFCDIADLLLIAYFIFIVSAPSPNCGLACFIFIGFLPHPHFATLLVSYSLTFCSILILRHCLLHMHWFFAPPPFCDIACCFYSLTLYLFAILRHCLFHIQCFFAPSQFCDIACFTIIGFFLPLRYFAILLASYSLGFCSILILRHCLFHIHWFLLHPHFCDFALSYSFDFYLLSILRHCLFHIH